MSDAVLSIGSNTGDALAHLQSAVDAFLPYGVSASAVFKTPPWGPVVQPDFLNAILLVTDPEATPGDWLARCQASEDAAGRTREVRWGPRTLDVDVITVGDLVSDDPVLTLPHPRAAERAFVLVPWWSLDPEATLPGHGSVLALMQALPADEVAAVQLVPGAELRS
jgi:2-amino-4-hydroxy-6-hydroxymethyldihydropteridine diphosphokinase